MKNIAITFQDIMKELETARLLLPNSLTPEQKKFLIAARGGKPSVPWPKILELWVKAGWGETSVSALARRHQRAKRIP